MLRKLNNALRTQRKKVTCVDRYLKYAIRLIVFFMLGVVFGIVWRNVN